MRKKILNNFIDELRLRQYHSENRKHALGILADIESVQGKTDPLIINQCQEYAADVLGWAGYAPWLFVYSALSGGFKEGWIPDNYYNRVVVPKLKGNYGKISNLNSLSYKMFGSDLFPDIACYVNGLWTTKKHEVIPGKELKYFLFRNSDKIVFKIDTSLQGRGVFIFTKETFDKEKIESLGNGVAQDFIRQHKFFDQLMPHSVATIRLTTIIDDKGDVSVRSAYLRIGRSSDFHVKSESHIRVPVNIETGELYQQGYGIDWLGIDKHPDTKAVFADKKIPAFDKCLSAVIELQKQMPFNRAIGWDMIVDENDNVKMMEWNGGHNDIKFSEATQGPCFADLGWENLWKKN